jgi:hypothetical protein
VRGCSVSASISLLRGYSILNSKSPTVCSVSSALLPLFGSELLFALVNCWCLLMRYCWLLRLLQGLC